MYPDLQQSLTAIETLCAAIPADSATKKPSPASWSVAEILEHVTMSETGGYLQIRQALASLPEGEHHKSDLHSRSQHLAEAISSRNVRLAAPESVQPTGRYGEWPAPLAAFIKIRNRVIDLAAKHDSRLDLCTIPHPALGDLTAREWCVFFAAHSMRHLEQIREVLAQS